MNRLYDHPGVWDKKERAGEEIVECWNCMEQRFFPKYTYQQTQKSTVPDKDWHMVKFVNIMGYMGFCDSGWIELRDRDMVVEQGRIPCAGYNCTTHTFHSDTLAECKERGRVPYTDDELAELKEQYHDRRHHTCPDCGTPIDEMSEGEIETYMDFRHNDLTGTADGYICDCGWEGFKHEMSYVKR